MGLFTYIHVVGVVSGIWGSLYHVNALRLQSTLVRLPQTPLGETIVFALFFIIIIIIIIIIFSDCFYWAEKN